MSRPGKSNVGELLKAIRVRNRKSRAQIAKEVGVTTQCVDFWESGQNRVSLRLLDKTAEAYGMTAEEKKQLEASSVEKYQNGRPAESSLQPLTESQIFSGWIALPEDSRKRILRAMNAYEETPRK